MTTATNLATVEPAINEATADELATLTMEWQQDAEDPQWWHLVFTDWHTGEECRVGSVIWHPGVDGLAWDWSHDYADEVGQSYTQIEAMRAVEAVERKTHPHG